MAGVAPSVGPVVIFDGVRLEPPRAEGDCSCRFCSLFRTRHLVVRAVLTSATVPIGVLLTLAVWNDSEDTNTGGGSEVVGALLIVVTLLAVLATATWYQPLRRWIHRRKPRSTAWPPAD